MKHGRDNSSAAVTIPQQNILAAATMGHSARPWVMAMLRWLSLAFVDKFSDELLRDASPMLLNANQPVDESVKVKKVAKLRVRHDAAMTSLHRQAVEFARREKLNFFQKARLSKQLQDGLIRCGQSAEFAKDFAVRVIADLR